jgi:hypothetical protein
LIFISYHSYSGYFTAADSLIVNAGKIIAWEIAHIIHAAKEISKKIELNTAHANDYYLS